MNKTIISGSVAALAACASQSTRPADSIQPQTGRNSAVEAPSEKTAPEQLFAALKRQDAEEVERLLAAEPALANAHRPDGVSAVLAALFAIKDELFLQPQSNPLLRAVLMRHPKLDAFEAAATGDVDTVAAEIDRDPAFVRAFNKPPVAWTALHFAAFAGSVDIAKLLLQRGGDVHARARTKFENTPLQAAALTGQTAVIRLLIEHGADVNVKQAEGATAMHEAALLGNEPLVTLLLDAGADINAKTSDGKTPLDLALRGSRLQVAELLRARGATRGSD